MRVPRILALVLAGGKGSRLGALTEKKVKPALPVAGVGRDEVEALAGILGEALAGGGA